VPGFLILVYLAIDQHKNHLTINIRNEQVSFALRQAAEQANTGYALHMKSRKAGTGLASASENAKISCVTLSLTIH